METTDRLDRWIPRLMVLVILGIAVFAFTQSYTHIFDLGQSHHQSGASLRMLPLSVDLLMVGAGLVMLHLKRQATEHWLPRFTLWGAATVTLLANVASGIIWGWESAVISAWAPVALFVAVELGMLVVRTAKAKAVSHEEVGQLAAGGSHRRSDRPDTASAYPVGAAADPLTELRQPQAAPEPSPDTATMPKAVDSPEPALEGWGQLAGQEPAGQPESLDRRPGLNGIGLRNRGQ